MYDINRILTLKMKHILVLCFILSLSVQIYSLNYDLSYYY